MAKRGIRQQEHEKLDDVTVGRVVSLLEQDNPITKKLACEILNIKYSTQRLNRIVESYKEKMEFRKTRFAQNKGKPFTELEIKELVSDYLNGDSISNIADSLYRSVYTIRKKIQELHLPERSKRPTYQNPDIIPDEAVAEDFEKGELVWSSRYNAVAEIRGTYKNAYSIFVFGKHNEFAYQPWWELGKLEAVKKYKLEATDFIRTEKSTFQYRLDDEGRTIR